MSVRQLLALTLGMALAVPPSAPAAAAGLVRGSVKTVAGNAVSGADVNLLSLQDGTLTRVRTDGGGAFEASLEPGSYKVELQSGYVVVSGPRLVSLAAGDTAPAELVVAQTTPGETTPDPQAGKPNRRGDLVALTLFGAALAGVAVYAATRGREDRLPPTTSASR